MRCALCAWRIAGYYNNGFLDLQCENKKTWASPALLGLSFLNAFRRPKILKDNLVRAKLCRVDSEKTLCVTTCLRPNTCRYCPKLNTDGRILCSASGRTYMSRYNMSCCSSNLIYCMTCKRCGIQYVGQTKCKLKLRSQLIYSKSEKRE